MLLGPTRELNADDDDDGVDTEAGERVDVEIELKNRYTHCV